ncbi:MAG: class I SAM-dependent methyltransferase [Burkholderiaceae bacterium]|nr:class I SAM-dependent methyltransferase [Burkholderiaceae bacterium]
MIMDDPLATAPPITRLFDALFGGSPYDGVVPIQIRPDLQGWNGTHPALSRLVRDLKPAIILDVGVWKGQSTITLAVAQKEVCEDGMVVAIDTFLGSPEHWSRARSDIRLSLRFKHGRPNFYETFLENVILTGNAERILPLAQTSENAAAILRKNKIVPDRVHIDAAHEYRSVLRDIEVYFDLLRPGGILVGDDFSWTGVARAVVNFTDKHHLTFEVDHPKWWFAKPSRASVAGERIAEE